MARAAPVFVKVVAGDGPASTDEAPPAGPLPGARFGKALPATFLEVTVDRTTAWVGQQITATTEVYTQQPLAQWPRLPAMKPPGFFCTSLLGDDRPAPSQRSIGGRAYYVYLVNKDALFPLGAGDKSIPVQSVDLVPAGSFFSRTREINVRSAATAVTVKPLPTTDQPARFSIGNVGHWQLQTAVRPAKGVLGEPLTLSITATGTGSLEQLELPTWEGGAEARVFPATQRREPRTTTLQDAELGGRVVVELLVQPQKEGPLRIPAFTLTTFNPDTGLYQQSTTQPLVVPIGAARSGATATSPGNGARQVIAKGARPLKRGVHDERKPRRRPRPRGARPVGAVVGGLRCGVPASSPGRVLGGTARVATARPGEDPGGRARPRDLAALERVLMDALAESFGPAVRGVSTGELTRLLEERLEARGQDRALATDVVAFIRDAEAARYTKTGGGTAERDKLATAAAALVARVEARP